MAILEHWRQRQFEIPSCVREFLALQIARRLNDLDHARDYAILLEHFPENLVVEAFQEAEQGGQLGRDGFLEAFRSILARPIEYDTYDDEVDRY